MSDRLSFKEGDRFGALPLLGDQNAGPPYRLVALLGRGGFSEVWHAQRVSGPWAGEDLAVKILTHPDHVAELKKEASALSIVRGDGIVRTIEACLDHEPPYLALELLRGGDLRKKLAASRGRLAPSDALRLVERMLEILARVHQDGVVHGDLKPENVLFAAEEGKESAGPRAGDLRLADFGLSRRIGQRSATLSVSLSRNDPRLAGTIEYMAPEQREGARATARSDIYAIGVVLHELLTGERPQGVFELPGKRDARLPPLVDRTLAHALALDPRERFEDAHAMLKFLRVGLWNDGEVLRASAKGLEERRVLAIGFPVLWTGSVLGLSAMCLNEVEVRGVAGLEDLAISASLAASPLLGALNGILGRGRKLARSLRRVELQVETLKAWREHDPTAPPDARGAEEVAHRARRRRGPLGHLVRMTRHRLWRARRSPNFTPLACLAILALAASLAAWHDAQKKDARRAEKDGRATEASIDSGTR